MNNQDLETMILKELKDEAASLKKAGAEENLSILGARRLEAIKVAIAEIELSLR